MTLVWIEKSNNLKIARCYILYAISPRGQLQQKKPKK